MLEMREVELAVQTYADMVRRLCFVHLKNTHDTEDLFQEVFLKLMTHKGSFADEEHKKAWLIRVTINACKDRLRDKFRTRVVLAQELLEDCLFDDNLSTAAFGNLDTTTTDNSSTAAIGNLGISANTNFDTSFGAGISGAAIDTTAKSDDTLSVLNAVIKLPKNYRLVVYLHFFEQYQATEIAKILHKNVNTIYTWLARAKQLLKQNLGSDLYG